MANGNHFLPYHPVLGVEHDNHEVLFVRPAQLAQDQIRCVPGASYGLPNLHCGVSQTLGQFKSGQDHRSLGSPNALHAHQLFIAGTSKGPQGTELRQQMFC